MDSLKTSESLVANTGSRDKKVEEAQATYLEISAARESPAIAYAKLLHDIREALPAYKSSDLAVKRPALGLLVFAVAEFLAANPEDEKEGLAAPFSPGRANRKDGDWGGRLGHRAAAREGGNRNITEVMIKSWRSNWSAKASSAAREWYDSKVAIYSRQAQGLSGPEIKGFVKAIRDCPNSGGIRPPSHVREMVRSPD